MTDLTNLDSLTGQPLGAPQLQGLLAQIDLNIANLLRDGKLAAARYHSGGETGQAMDRAANLKALLEARAYYERLLNSQADWALTQHDDGQTGSHP